MCRLSKIGHDHCTKIPRQKGGSCFLSANFLGWPPERVVDSPQAFAVWFFDPYPYVVAERLRMLRYSPLFWILTSSDVCLMGQQGTPSRRSPSPGKRQVFQRSPFFGGHNWRFQQAELGFSRSPGKKGQDSRSTQRPQDLTSLVWYWNISWGTQVLQTCRLTCTLLFFVSHVQH